jgi:1-acyl-sn-glycerol-3-phosphate acyltransferase
MDSKFDAIRPFYDSEINAEIQSIAHNPMMQTVMQFTFPEKTVAERLDILANIQTIQAFQGDVVYLALQKILKQTSAGLTNSGFEKLEPDTAYLFISNHRDIFLDTSLLNCILYERGLTMTASAIGDNLVKVPFFKSIAKINRNFIVLRGLSPRELLQSSKLMSEFIQELLRGENRSVWIAQREGRTKDGNDATNPGILKMIAMAAGKEKLVSYFKKLRIVPVSISYEQDPTDALKLPELLAKMNNETYIKHEKEDFNSIMQGMLGQKKRIHIHAGTLLDTELDALLETENGNQQIKMLAQLIDNQIVGNYKLWANNYIAYDLLHETNQYATQYSEVEKQDFEARLASKVPDDNVQARKSFLEMYANPIKA